MTFMIESRWMVFGLCSFSVIRCSCFIVVWWIGTFGLLPDLFGHVGGDAVAFMASAFRI